MRHVIPQNRRLLYLILVRIVTHIQSMNFHIIVIYLECYILIFRINFLARSIWSPLFVLIMFFCIWWSLYAAIIIYSINLLIVKVYSA